VIGYIGDYIPAEWKDSVKASSVPENWDQLRVMVEYDTVMTPAARKRILKLSEDLSHPDEVDRKLSRLPEYRYLREKIYPRLRSVSFDCHLHRVGMQKDTIHTTELDTAYMAGLDALRDMDYRKAVENLRPYRDLNSAVAFVAADYNHSALDILDGLDDGDAKVCYMKALVLARLGQMDEARKYFDLCLIYDPSMQFRANLDPEMHEFIKINEPY
jgi:tetratricopeptide (TPR) repeat protein